MNVPGLHPALRAFAARNLRVDLLTVEATAVLAADGIDSIVLKGPAIADWLYPDHARVYGDSDLMVRAGDWARAVAALERSGFENYLEPMAHPRMESFASTAFVRGTENVDLHCTLHGLAAAPEAVAEAIMEDAVPLAVGGAVVRAPDRPALLLHIGLHAAHHAEGKALEDLRRAIAAADAALWERALELARDLGGVAAFATGLKLLVEGRALAAALGIAEVSSTPLELRYAGVPTAEGIDALLAPGIGTRQRLATLTREFFPPPAFLRWWTPLARRGPLGLALAYPWRALWLIAHAPRGIIARRRVRRASVRS